MSLDTIFERWWQDTGSKLPDTLSRRAFAFACLRAGAALVLALQQRAQGSRP